MEFLQTLLSFAPVTTSSLIIVLVLGVIACASVVFLKGVNFTLNSESWGKEVIDSGVLFDKLYGLLFKVHSTWNNIRFKHDSFELVEVDRGFSYSCPIYKYQPFLETYFSGGSINRSSTGKVFKTKQEAYTWAEKQKELSQKKVVKGRLPKTTLLLPILIDLCLYTFTLAPLLTITVVSTATLVMSVRWVSGKLANNVKNTDNNTKRIDDIEEKLKDE